jgi:hypothetical protein
MNTIMVQLSDVQWTREAMHLASALAVNTGSRVVLLQLIEVNHPALLGWDLAPGSAKQEQIEDCAAIAEDYGVEFHLQPMQYVTLTDALAQAVETHEASALFANIPEGKLPFWRRVELWNLNRQLGNCQLYTLGKEQVLRVEGSMRKPVSNMKPLPHS